MTMGGKKERGVSGGDGRKDNFSQEVVKKRHVIRGVKKKKTGSERGNHEAPNHWGGRGGKKKTSDDVVYNPEPWG